MIGATATLVERLSRLVALLQKLEPPLLGFPALVLIPDLGFLLGATAVLLGWSLLRRDRVKREWRRMTIASCVIGSCAVLVYLMDVMLVAEFRG